MTSFTYLVIALNAEEKQGHQLRSYCSQPQQRSLRSQRKEPKNENIGKKAVRCGKDLPLMNKDFRRPITGLGVGGTFRSEGGREEERRDWRLWGHRESLG